MWEKVAKFGKRGIPVSDPIGLIHKLGKEAGAKSVSDIAISKTTEEYLRMKVEKALMRTYPHLTGRMLDSAIGYTMLEYGPVVETDLEDFTLYVWRGKKRRKTK